MKLFSAIGTSFRESEFRFKHRFWNSIFVSNFLLKFKFKDSFPELKLPLWNRTFVSKIKESFLESKLLFWNEICVSGIGDSFLNCYYNSNWKLRLQDQRIISVNEASILETKYRFRKESFYSGKKTLTTETKLQFRKLTFKPGNKASNLNYNNMLEKRKRS